MYPDFDSLLRHPSPPTETDRLWAIVLAGGDGNRLASITTHAYGYPRPKQFCALLSAETLLEQTIRRVRRYVSAERVVVSTTRRWRREAAQCLTSLPQVQTCEQPSNLGTTPGLLTALLAILAVDPEARVVVCPADHYVSDDDAFMAVATSALGMLRHDPERVVLLGARLPRPSDGLGWIRTTPGDDGLGWGTVRAFVEKPPPEQALQLHSEGALANTFAMVAHARGLASLVARHCPQWWRGATDAYGRREALENLYERLPPSDLSKEVLQRSAPDLRVLPLDGVEWSDIGTAERLAQVTSLPPLSAPQTQLDRPSPTTRPAGVA
ncbi:MAG: NTP transferase domain-containing protein [Myxococcales bacterium]|nr:NTP transferase domain-containing protein [Myxococcales bacterium]